MTEWVAILSFLAGAITVWLVLRKGTEAQLGTAVVLWGFVVCSIIFQGHYITYKLGNELSTFRDIHKMTREVRGLLEETKKQVLKTHVLTQKSNTEIANKIVEDINTLYKWLSDSGEEMMVAVRLAHPDIDEPLQMDRRIAKMEDELKDTKSLMMAQNRAALRLIDGIEAEQ